MATEKRLIDLEKIKPIDFPSVEMDGLDVVRYLNTLPTVDAMEVVHGRWLTLEEYAEKIGADTTGYIDGWSFCSECEQQMRTIYGWNYCPNCGAKMDGDGNA